MLPGYAGKIGLVDLSLKQINIERLPEHIAREFIGGKGIGAYFLYRYLLPRLSPYDPKNLLIFATGPIVGTGFPASARAAVITKSPLSETFLDTYAGGSFGPRMKYAGFDLLIVSGKAERPVYLLLENGEIFLKDASSMWGLSTFETEEHLMQKFGENRSQRISVATIGRAGENLVRYASIITGARAFGRGGSGAVMGSKNLKAVVVKGDSHVTIHDHERLKKIEKRCRENIAKHPMTGKNGAFPKIGTMITIDVTQETGTLPTKNWTENTFENADLIDAGAFEQHIVRARTCLGCPIGCSRDTKTLGRDTEVITEGPEYETIYAFGSNCEIGNKDVIIEADRLCDEYGMDTISCGVAIGFAMECFESGLISKKQTEGLQLKFGSEDAVLELIHRIANRKGIGTLLAEGVKRASLGISGSADFAMHVKGLELPGYDPRGMKGQALSYALSDRGGCHMRSNTLRSELLGMPEAVDRYDYKGKARMVRDLQMGYVIVDSLISCAFGSFAITPDDHCQALSAITGWDVNLPELKTIAERIWNLTRVLNIREGIGRHEDTLPERLFSKASTKGPSRGQTVDRASFEEMLETYYELCGWDKQTGVPTNEKLRDLGLREVLANAETLNA
jgi:aldehyde:ferredoxin oxidoreductase